MGQPADELSFRIQPQKENAFEKGVMSGKKLTKLSLSPGKFRALYFLRVSSAWKGGTSTARAIRQTVHIIAKSKTKHRNIERFECSNPHFSYLQTHFYY